MIRIPIDDILKATNIYNQNRFVIYNQFGGIYLIYDNKNNKGYIGQSQNYLFRLRTHILNIKRGKYSEIEFNDCIDDLSFYLILKFDEICNLNYYNEDIIRFIEASFIKRYNTIYPFGYNKILEKNKVIESENEFKSILKTIIHKNTKRTNTFKELYKLLNNGTKTEK